MHFISEELEDYCLAHSTAETTLLKHIHRETYSKVLMPRMLSGHLQGLFLQMISCMIKPKNILEIGTFTGYSAICLCKGLDPQGKLLTIDKNEEIEERVQAFFDASEYKNQIEYRIGNAMELIPALTDTYDLVFIDADKINYARYFEMVIDKVQPGGFILADNVLWSGKILGEIRDKDTRALDDFNKMVAEDSRIEKMILPLRDGITLMRKL
jgi:predicted O-methyltransferase YrrM